MNKYWYNASKKPKGFKCVDKNTYEYPVSIIYDDYQKANRIIVDFEILSIKYYPFRRVLLKT